MLEARYQFLCVAEDNADNPANASGYLSSAQLSRILREQLLGLDVQGGFTLPDGTVISDLWIIDEFDAHYELGGTAYLYRRALQVGMLFKEPDVAYVPSPSGGGSVTLYLLAPSPDGTTLNFTTTSTAVMISANAQLFRNGMLQTPSQWSASGTVISFTTAPNTGDELELFQ
jgi:hypothetical protein